MRPTTLRTLAALLLAAAGAAPLDAQVGHLPGASPYREIAKGHTFTPFAGKMFGAGGRFGIGPHQGMSYGFLYDVRISNPLSFSVAGSYADTERLIVNPFVRVADRVSGPVDQSLLTAEVGLQFTLTGQKSWNRLAPHLGFGLGLARAGETAADTSGFEFGASKIFFNPRVGVRAFLAPNVHLRTEMAFPLWKLDYPTSFQQEPVDEPGTDDEPNAVITDGRTGSWTVTPWLRVGLGYTFTF
jgi:hypothetical protein